jgi:hypothetical protein
MMGPPVAHALAAAGLELLRPPRTGGHRSALRIFHSGSVLRRAFGRVRRARNNRCRRFPARAVTDLEPDSPLRDTAQRAREAEFGAARTRAPPPYRLAPLGLREQRIIWDFLWMGSRRQSGECHHRRPAGAATAHQITEFALPADAAVERAAVDVADAAQARPARVHATAVPAMRLEFSAMEFSGPPTKYWLFPLIIISRNVVGENPNAMYEKICMKTLC